MTDSVRTEVRHKQTLETVGVRAELWVKRMKQTAGNCNQVLVVPDTELEQEATVPHRHKTGTVPLTFWFTW